MMRQNNACFPEYDIGMGELIRSRGLHLQCVYATVFDKKPKM